MGGPKPDTVYNSAAIIKVVGYRAFYKKCKSYTTIVT